MALQAGPSRNAGRGAQDDGKLKRFVSHPGNIIRYSEPGQIAIIAAMYTHGLPAPQVLHQTQIRRAVVRRVDKRQIVRAVVAEPPAADELVQLSSKVTKDIRGERRKYNFAAGPGCLPKSVLEDSAGRPAELQWRRRQRHGDVPPLEGVHRHLRPSREGSATAAGHIRCLRGAP